jgi:hypothetical protein
MKRTSIIVGALAAALLAGCASTPVAVARVGPNPSGLNDHGNLGHLEVFSALVGRTEGDNPTWLQHRNYVIYDQNGKRIKLVINRPGYYAEQPRLVSLLPGRYIVQAEAKDYLSVKVPVIIEAGRTTRVHLDDAWLPGEASKTELVRLPEGNPVGWSANDK